MDWKSVAEKIVQDDQNKWDRKASAKEPPGFRFGQAGVLENSTWNGSHPLSDLTVTQMCQKLEIPVKYYRRLPDEMKATVANFDIGRLTEIHISCAARVIGYARFSQPLVAVDGRTGESLALVDGRNS